MAVKVQIPTQLRSFVGGASEVAAEGGRVDEVLRTLASAHPGLNERLFDDGGKLRRFVNVYVNDEDVRFLNGVETTVADSDRIVILPAVAGG